MPGLGVTCFLSGLEIPEDKITNEHYYPKSLLPSNIANRKDNIFPAHKIINNVKGNLLPCEWEEQKIGLTLYAIKRYHIKSNSRQFLRAALKNWETYKINPCDYCIARKFENYCIKCR